MGIIQIAKVTSSSVQKNRAGKEILTVTVELRKGQLITADWINQPGQSDGVLEGDWVVVISRSQSTGNYIALGIADIINSIFADKGVKILYSRTEESVAACKVTMTDTEIILENPSLAQIEIKESEIKIKNSAGAQVDLKGVKVELNQGAGVCVEAERLQTALNVISQAFFAELGRVQAGTLPNPVNPYVPTPIPFDISASRSESVVIP